MLELLVCITSESFMHLQYFKRTAQVLIYIRNLLKFWTVYKSHGYLFLAVAKQIDKHPTNIHVNTK